MNKKICIVQSTYNEDITNTLSKTASLEPKNSGINKIDKIMVPGAFEIPGVIARLVQKYDGFVAIGCIIKGETLNFDLISYSITNGIMQISIDEKKPIGNGIITCFNKNQAMSRLDKGKEAAKAVLKVLELKSTS